MNYYTNEFHGEPVTFAELANAETALNVLEGYPLKINMRVVLILVLGIHSLILTKGFLHKAVIRRRYSVAAIVFISCFIMKAYFAEDSLIPKNTNMWFWGVRITKYGYIPVLFQQTRVGMLQIQKPKTYDENRTIGYINSYEIKGSNERTKSPDIILILNKILYDLDTVLDTDNRKEEFSYMSSGEALF